ncbi:capsule biosynthesis GfcC family protein [Paenibacillus brevis]|uniref:Capsule biosynthesis GfcC family protein n=1 Tax=Paenibacillus brevis TaxID=2841508 RepID=A0ABS6FR20_9BACL|nr:capsule biosynthesis GfcC family protein [Paenibacillus brevis]MBU5672684.1 capsule biosynthesis GfcC family protein [Paenibacillus brevis]
MSNYHFRKLLNEVNKDRQHRIKQLTHQSRYGNLSEDDAKAVAQALLTIGGGA